MNKAAINTHVQVFVDIRFQFLWVNTRVLLLDGRGRSEFDFTVFRQQLGHSAFFPLAMGGILPS